MVVLLLLALLGEGTSGTLGMELSEVELASELRQTTGASVFPSKVPFPNQESHAHT